MPTISDSNAKILQEYIPKLLTYIKKYAVVDISDKPRTLGYKQVNFYHPNYINDHQTILGIVLTLIENLSTSNKGFSLLLGDLYVFAGHLWVRSCEIELEKCEKKSHSELKRYISYALLSVGSSFVKAKQSYQDYMKEIALIEKGQSFSYSLSTPLTSIFSYKDNENLLNGLFADGFDSAYYFDEYGIETENLHNMTRMFVSTMVAVTYKELEQLLNEEHIGQGLMKYYYQNNHFQKDKNKQSLVVVLAILALLWFLFFR